MGILTTVLVWLIAVISSLVALSNQEPLDRLRVLNLWGAGIVIWALTYTWLSPTQIAAGIILADAAMSFVLIGVVVAVRAARMIKEKS